MQKTSKKPVNKKLNYKKPLIYIKQNLINRLKNSKKNSQLLKKNSTRKSMKLKLKKQS